VAVATKIGVKPRVKAPSPPKPASEQTLHIIGQPLPKVDAMAKVCGETVFVDDLSLPRMLYCKIKRSPHPHARILKVDTTGAQRLPGVVATLVGWELPIPFGILPVSQDEHALAIEKARFVGDPVAAVAAVDEETAELALRHIDVTYQVLRPIMSIEEALEEEEVRVHDYGPRGNIHKTVSLQFGDLEEGFREADHVREDTFFFEGNTHLPMEQHAAVASYGADGVAYRPRPDCQAGIVFAVSCNDRQHQPVRGLAGHCDGDHRFVPRNRLARHGQYFRRGTRRL